MDPGVAERLMAQGKLPHLAWMKEHGSMRALGTTNPAQSPVAWSAFATGSNPGKTRI
jgi:predicted AlkP superfamily phosphohydrolase/phosphomutase